MFKIIKTQEKNKFSPNISADMSSFENHFMTLHIKKTIHTGQTKSKIFLISYVLMCSTDPTNIYKQKAKC